MLHQKLASCRGVWQGQTRELLQQQELWRKAAQQSSATAQGLQQVSPAWPMLPQGQHPHKNFRFHFAMATCQPRSYPTTLVLFGGNLHSLAALEA